VPNGSLISSEVTNWTFSDFRRARRSRQRDGKHRPPACDGIVEEYCRGSTWCRKGTAQEVYLTNFTAAAVTLQLRAWTDRYRDWAQLRSDLSFAANEALAREKITIT
jgi:small-conductance mechanosensitive channel